MLYFLTVIIGILAIGTLFVLTLCLENSKECYICGTRLDKYSTSKYRLTSNKGFCSSHCKDIYKRDQE